jgi:PAS domain S-box-containing protein
LDLNGKIRLWNRAAESLLGWTEKEVIGQGLPMLKGAERTAFTASMALQVHEDAPRLCCRWSTRRQEHIEVEIAISGWVSPDTELQGVFLMITDLSERRRVEVEHERLKKLADEAKKEADVSRRFRELLEAAPDAILKVDHAGKIVLMNRATESLFGYTREELTGQPVEILVPQAARQAHVDRRAGYWEHPVNRPMGRGLTLSAVRKDGTEFPVEISLSPVDTETEVKVVAIIRDVTGRKRIEAEMRSMELRFNETLASTNAELERRNSEVERADQLKSEFLASMSHELRTPLHTIIGFSELLSEEIEGVLNEKQRRFVGHILRDSKHLLELINDILDLSKIESGNVELHPEVFTASTELTEVVDSIRPGADSKSIRIKTRIEDDLVLRADRVRFREVLYNLLSNALKFTPSGGCITVAADEGDSPGFCRFAVEDTGIGILPGQEKAIFDKFYQVGSTTKGVREGTGLGLTITRHIVELHGGNIWVESEVGKGSCFRFTMPCEKP